MITCWGFVRLQKQQKPTKEGERLFNQEKSQKDGEKKRKKSPAGAPWFGIVRGKHVITPVYRREETSGEQMHVVYG